MKVLVTGANGFIGRAVCRRLLAAGWEVHGAVRRQVDLPEGVVARRISALGPGIPWAETLAGMRAVVHLAARVHVMRDEAADPLAEYRRVNTEATLHLMREARRVGVGRLVFMSSIKVNGEATEARPFTAADPPAPQDPYAVSKYEAEEGLAELARGSSVRVTILRPPLVYGPGVGGNFLALLRAVARGWPLPLGAVANRRSLLFVDNLADAVAKVMGEPTGECETFVLRDGEDVSTAELARRLGRCLGRPARLPPVPLSLLALAGRLTGRAAAVARLTGSLTVDDSAFRRRFAWEPPFTLDQGLETTAAWFRAAAP